MSGMKRKLKINATIKSKYFFIVVIITHGSVKQVSLPDIITRFVRKKNQNS